jgi:hypothetical protein
MEKFGEFSGKERVSQDREKGCVVIHQKVKLEHVMGNREDML